MAKCDCCGDEVSEGGVLKVEYAGKVGEFCCVQCAIHGMTPPTCAMCGVTILGHTVEKEGKIYCCSHCAGEMGGTEAHDH